MEKTLEKNESSDKADVWLDLDNPHRTISGSLPNFQDVLSNQAHHNQYLTQARTRYNRYLTEGTELKLEVATSHFNQNIKQFKDNSKTLLQDIKDIKRSLDKAKTPFGLWKQWLSYSTDSTKRLLQTADILKERGDIFIEHELAGCPPVLDYEYEIILDAGSFERPCNYVLLRIKPPAGVEIDENNRPYIIIDPRAGHGAGIGGFKPESQVGVALNNGRPVYFVAFKRLPEPTQTIADVTYAEARFVREVEKRHPNAQSPVIVGNCQGGWAVLIMAATHSDIKGPIVMNGAPVSAWSGRVGVDPMRYKAGVNGGTWLAMMSADLTNGVFDGAWLVNNFEQMNPYQNYVGKYYDLYKNPMANRDRFLDFERWWGGFFLMNEAEIRWIVENIFIGNRIARNTGQLEKGVNIDLRNVKAPIIVFASNGDDITPPPQALAWILDAYTDEKEIEVYGQRIIYMIHEQVGHLGIFVSSKVANHEHTGMASVMDMIEILPPGLYEMKIADQQGSGQEKTFAVDLERRTFDNLSQAIGECRTDEKVFRAVHRSSKSQTRVYEQTLRPLVQAMSNETSAQILRSLHPLRLQRSLWSSKNPMALAASSLNNFFGAVKAVDSSEKSESKMLGGTDKQRSSTTQNYGKIKLPGIEPINQDNVFLQIEKMFVDSTSMTMNFWGDLNGKLTETTFYELWTLPWFRQYGSKEASRRLLDKDAVRDLPKVDEVLSQIEKGGYPEAVIRMLILANIVADNNIDRNQLLRLTEVVTEQAPFKDLLNSKLARIIENQTLMVRFDQEKSIEALKTLLKDKSKRGQAFEQVQYVVGNEKNNLNPKTILMLNLIAKVLELPEYNLPQDETPNHNKPIGKNK